MEDCIQLLCLSCGRCWCKAGCEEGDGRLSPLDLKDRARATKAYPRQDNVTCVDCNSANVILD